MKKYTVICAIAYMVIFIFAGTASSENSTISRRNAKVMAMGGSKVAGGFNYNGFVNNPALLSRVKYFRLSVIPARFTTNKNVVDLANFINDNQDNFNYFSIDDPTDPNYMTPSEKEMFFDDVQKEDGKWGNLRYAPTVDMAVNVLGHGLGLAIYNMTDVAWKIDRGIYEPRVWGQGYSYTAVVLGYARPLSMFVPGLTVGVNLKYMDRRKASLFKLNASEMGDIQDTVDPVLEELKNNEHTSYGMDIGALYEVPLIDADVGAVIYSLGDGRGSSVDLGIAKRMYSDRLTLLADYIDFTDNNKENLFNKIHLGAQYQFWFLALRAGINSGYPVFGAGLNFKVIDIDFASFTEELGNAPGANPDQRYMLQLKMGW